MWANYYPEIVSCSPTKKQALARSLNAARPCAVRVAIIPLDDVEGIVERAARALWRQNNGGVIYYDREHAAIRAALTAAGIPCCTSKRRAGK